MFELLDLLNIPLTSVLLYVIMFICAWLLLRDIKCWYYRIHEITRNQEYQTELMEDILNELRKQNAQQKTEATQSVTAETTETDNKESTP